MLWILPKGDVIAIDMPMTVSAVIIYLAIILSGRIVVSIADSFAAKEIATRLRVSQAKGVFTQVVFCLCISCIIIWVLTIDDIDMCLN